MQQLAYSHSPFTGQIHCSAPVTPFSPAGDLMLDAFQEVLRFHLEIVKVDALLIAGDNGEGYALTDQELRRVVEATVKSVGGRVPCYVHVSRTENDRCRTRAVIAAEAGAYGIALCQPYIHDASPDKIVKRFEMVAQAAALPMMVYNLPLISHFNITPQVMRHICDVAPVEVLKDAPTDMAHITAMLNAMGERFPILYGQRYTMIPALLLGSGGFVGTGPELFRERCRDFFKIDEMEPRERARLQKRYAAVNTALLHELGKAPAGIKAAMNLLGVPAGVPRDHVSPLTPAETEALRRVLIDADILEADAPVARSA